MITMMLTMVTVVVVVIVVLRLIVPADVQDQPGGVVPHQVEELSLKVQLVHLLLLLLLLHRRLPPLPPAAAGRQQGEQAVEDAPAVPPPPPPPPVAAVGRVAPDPHLVHLKEGGQAEVAGPVDAGKVSLALDEAVADPEGRQDVRQVDGRPVVQSGEPEVEGPRQHRPHEALPGPRVQAGLEPAEAPGDELRHLEGEKTIRKTRWVLSKVSL